MLKLKKEIESLRKELDKEESGLEPLVKDFLFLFQGPTCVNGYEYSYSESNDKFGGNSWFVNITYYAGRNSRNVSLHVNTGVHHYKPFNSDTIFDSPDDVAKIKMAFESSCRSIIKNLKGNLKYTKQSKKLLRQLKK